MTPVPQPIPFVDLHALHQPIQKELDAAIAQVLERGDFILGQAVRDFEAAFAQACDVEYGVGVACGTDAIALGLQACGIRKGDEVIVPANTFIATVIGVLHAEATPVLVDCDPHTALIDLDAVEQAITPRTRAILPVHLYGQVVSPRKLREIAAIHNLIIFEDAAQAHLGQRDGEIAGSIGMAAAFSFYPSKNLGTAGNGGMVVTQNPDVAERVRSLRNYGAPKKYVHVYRGTNSRLDTLQGTVLNVKLPYLGQWNQQRNHAAQTYDRRLSPLKELGVVPMRNDCGPGHVYHLYVIQVDSPHGNRDTLSQALAEQGIQTGIHYPIPCHLQPAYRNLGYSAGNFPVSEQLSEQILSLPMYPGLSDEDIERVVYAIKTHLSTSSSA
ncbi:MAG: DegT/DnrJ/EryC1/StrS aminotransferase family protein [Sodalinema sp.]|uniref:DegT/DnrJ/EryC1/StrS family aminotransferase n=1 Tax=Sodalinema sp. TaxID=3080550 RepID=UPI0011FBEEA4|nr:MAG: DegT/DnrJ/EryC1/StrS aminotransferase family protein [Phormidium sp. SL48-SHIP]